MTDRARNILVAVVGAAALALGVARGARVERFASFTPFTPPNVGTTAIGGGGGGGGTGTVTSITIGTGLASTQSPLTTSGTMSVNIAGASCAAGTQVSAISAAGAGTCSADVTSIVAGTSISQSTTNGAATVNVAITPNTAGDGQVAVSQTAAGVVAFGQPSVDYKDGFVIYDEFLNPGATNNMWVSGSSGTSASCTSVSGTSAPNHPGIADCQTGSTTGGVGMVVSGGVAGNTTTNQVVFSGGVWTFETLVGFPTLSNSTDGYAAQIGFLDVTNSVNHVDGCYFEYDERNAAGHNATNLQDWIAVCASNSTRKAVPLDGATACENSFGTSVLSAVSAFTLPDTNWDKLKVVVNAAGTVAQFYVGHNGAAYVEVCELTSNIPATAARNTGYGMAIRKSVGTAALHMYVDWARITFAETTPRT